MLNVLILSSQVVVRLHLCVCSCMFGEVTFLLDCHLRICPSNCILFVIPVCFDFTLFLMTFLQVRWDDDSGTSLHDRVSPWEIELSSLVPGFSLPMASALKRPKMNLPSISLDFPLPGMLSRPPIISFVLFKPNLITEFVIHMVLIFLQIEVGYRTLMNLQDFKRSCKVKKFQGLVLHMVTFVL